MIGTHVREYIVERLLGEGGMGAVYLARHAVMGKQRAIKVLLPAWTQSPEIVQRFINEARAAALIENPNIIEVHDCGQLPNGQWFIVLPYLQGGTLAGFIASTGGPLAPHLIVRILGGVANGLQAAHDRGILHRDLKPENIFLTTRGRDEHHPIVLDFGMAKLAENIAGGVRTQVGLVCGTPSYMPPEQLRGAIVGPAADVFALACIAYEMATGGALPYQQPGESRDAFVGLPIADLAVRQATTLPTDPRASFAGMSEAWASALLAALDPDPARRPQTPREFLLRLAEATPSDGYEPDGIAIVKEYAPELEIDAVRATTRTPVPVVPAATASGAGVPSRYQLGTKLGEGGMAEVYMGTLGGAEGFARQVAIKRVHSGFAKMRSFASMFIQEARVAASLQHENIVSVLDFDRDEAGALFLVMEYVEGRDLSAVLRTGKLPYSVAAHITSEILRALAYAHRPRTGLPAGIVHRDISPHNVLVSWEGGVKVADFGIAKAADASEGGVSFVIRGKPHYMSPEQIACAPLDGRADLFAAGIILWEMLAGRALFQGTLQEVQAQVSHRDIPKPSTIARGVPPDLEAVAMKLLRRDRDQRFASAELAIEALSQCKSAPRNGRSELVRLLAERFDERARVPGAPLPTRPPTKVTVTESPRAAHLSTLAGAASEAMRVAKGPRSRVPWLVGIGLLVGGAIGTGIAMRSGGTADAGDQAHAAQLGRPLDASVGAATTPDAPQLATIPRDASVPDAAQLAAAPRDAPAPDAGAVAVTPVDAGASPTVAAKVAPKRAWGALVVHVDPWADVSVDGRAPRTTPIQTTLTAGAHRVRLVNPVRHKDETILVTIDPTKPTVIEKSW